MKRLISLCRKSPFIKRSLGRDNLPFTLSIMTMLVVASCQQLSHRSDVAEQVTPEDGATPEANTASTTNADTSTNEDEVTATLIHGTGRHTLATVSSPAGDACASAQALHLEFKLISRFGESKIKAQLSASPAAVPAADATVATRVTNDVVNAEVDGAVINFPAPAGLLSSLKARVCAAAGAKEIALEAESEGRLREIVERVAPDCERLETAAQGYDCNLPTVDPDAARTELVGIQTSMIRRWSRQPYLLARRLAIGVTLAQSLQSNDPEKSLDTFCRLVGSSLPAELPATIASKRWQRAACGSDKKARIDAALFGLAKTVSEIDVMRQLFERTSRLGHLSVKIPTTEVGNRRVLISLTPDADVAENLARETARLYSTEPVTDAIVDEAPRACWHPLYSESPELFDLARQLTLAGEADQLSCQVSTGVPASNPAFTPQRYFSESITSETEFVVTNGRAKTLRLPMGHYSYTVRVLPDDPGAWDDASQVPPRGRGTIAWDAKRPRAVIAEW